MLTNYQSIVSEILLSLRGGRSSAELSKLLGYQYNQVNRWETGEKQLRWDEFCHYCQTLNIPISKILSDIFQYEQTDPLGFLAHLSANQYPIYSIQNLADKLHRHPSAIRRYLDGSIFPDLEFVLAFIDLDINRLAYFLTAIFPTNYSSKLRAEIESGLKLANAEAENPIAAGIEGWIATTAYKALEEHSDEFIAERVGTTATEVQSILPKMLQAGTIIKTVNGKFAVNYDTINMTGTSSKTFNRFRRFWSQRAALRYKDDGYIDRGLIPGKGSCRVVAVSKETGHQINEILLRADAEIRMAIADGTESYDDVRVIVMHSLSTLDF